MVFNPDKAPKKEDAFLEWYEKQTEWEEDHGYDDPNISDTKLRSWFLEMNESFPSLNGPSAPDNIDEIIDDENLTDYSIGKDVIYAAFSWSVAKNAFPKMLELAEKYRIGFYDCSGNGDILFPNENGSMQNIVKKENKSKKPWWKIFTN